MSILTRVTDLVGITDTDATDVGTVVDTEPVVLAEVSDDLADNPPLDFDLDHGEEVADTLTISIDGFEFTDDRAAINIKSFAVPGTEIILAVRADVAPLLIGFAEEFNKKVEPLHKGWCWGYAYRPVRGSSNPSFHGAGIAIDLNAPTHPLKKVGTFNSKQVAVINALAAKYGLRWGGNYAGRKDEMHFELILSRTEALELVSALQKPPANAGFKFYPTLNRLKYRNRHSHVGIMQKELKDRKWYSGPVNNFYDWPTRLALRAFQRRIKTDQQLGLMDAQTYQALFGKKPSA
jgi:hypothetical protein